MLASTVTITSGRVRFQAEEVIPGVFGILEAWLEESLLASDRPRTQLDDPPGGGYELDREPEQLLGVRGGDAVRFLLGPAPDLAQPPHHARQQAGLVPLER